MSSPPPARRRIAFVSRLAYALGIIAIFAGCNEDSNTPTAPQTPRPAPATAGTPGTVTDLAVDGTASSSATLSFTEVDDGTGQPAQYDVRYAVTPISWGSAPSVTQGTCTTPVAGTTIGAHRTCTVLGLAPATGYDFQLVAYRGTLNQDAVFGGLSNIASGTTTAATVWPNEPTGFTLLTDYGLDDSIPATTGQEAAVGSTGWWVVWNDSGYVTHQTDAAAPLTPPNVAQFHWPVGFTGAVGMGALGYDFLPTRRLYVGIWWKASDPWQGHASNVNKIQYIFSNGSGSMFMAMYGVPGGPYEIRVYPQFSTSLERWLTPNVHQVNVTLGTWHRIEWLVDYSGASGHIQWWMDGTLLGDYSDDPPPPEDLIEYKADPVWGGTGDMKTESDYYWYDQIHLSDQ